ncbi:MAG: beta-ketoacyl synthase N-terminal-like domain-containing protein, partial [Armatimonadota bacterium]
MQPRPSVTQPQPNRRVVITGIGVVAPGAVGARAFALALRRGRSGVGPLTRFDATGLPCRLAAEVAPEIGPSVPWRDRCIQYAVAAADEAVGDAGLDEAALRSAGVVMGATKAGPEAFEEACARVAANGAPACPAGLLSNLAD